MRNEETEQNIKMRTYLLSAFLRCVYDQLTFKVDEPNVVEEGEIEKIKKKFKKMLQTTNTFKKILLMVNTCVTANSFNITNLAAKFLQISSIFLVFVSIFPSLESFKLSINKSVLTSYLLKSISCAILFTYNYY